MQEKIKKILYGGTSDFGERLFRLILMVGLVVTAAGILAGLFLENSLLNAAPLCVLLLVILISSVATFKYHQITFASIFFALLVICGIFPLMFFVSGGIDGGAAVWLVLGILYIFMVFRGRRLAFFLWLSVSVDIATYAVAYKHPWLVSSIGGKGEAYYDSLFSVLTVGMAVGLVMWFQLKLYEREREITLLQKNEIEQMSKSKDAFFTNMSHELRSPINAIIGLNEMILREEISDEVAENALHVKNASQMLLNLINDILDFSQIESDRMVIVPAAYQTKNLFTDAVDLLQIRMREKNLEFLVDIDSSLPSVLVGDEVRIKQILVNLLTNAVKYTQKGSVTLEVRGEPGEEGMERLTMSVSDTGIGIKKENLESLYDYFKRIDREQNRKIKGSGLGLAITKQLVSLMGGTLTVDSIYTKGSVFTVTLDQSIQDAQPIGRVDYLGRMRSREGCYYKQSFEAPLAKILVVDDNETNLMVVEKLLRATKVQIDQAKSGKECLELLEKKTYHVVLLDRMMPGMDGLETLKEIRKYENEVRRQTPVIVLTADTTSGMEQRCLDSGFDGYLAKPVDGGLMEAEILKFLPAELIEYQRNPEEGQDVPAAKGVLGRKRKKLQISTDCVSDLSEKYMERYHIKMMYQYIETEKGIFRDTVEIDADNLSRYLSREGNRTSTVSASVEEYELFYAEALTEAEDVIHISMAADAGMGYGNALAAARGFDHVHVIDAGQITCGEGLLVLTACRLLENGCNQVDALCSELNQVKKLIDTSLLLPRGEGRMGGGAGWLCRRLRLYPVVEMQQGGMKVHAFSFGKPEAARRRYIRRKLRRKAGIDSRVVFITHAGCTVRQQKEFVEEVLKCIPFENVILEKASVSCASSTGLGTMGMAFLVKSDGVEYNL